ncbi:MAG: TonB-dependent receptor [Candidatus Delongbacteria bacterium]|nr:TonB-dependent receptor [Candidatus Delongbacteria bacterium]
MKRFIILLVLLYGIGGLSIQAQPNRRNRDEQPEQGRGRGCINGLVIDAVSSRPVKDAIITLIPSRQVAFSDAAGSFSFTRIPSREYILEVRKVGYSLFTQTHVDVVKRDTANVTLYLLPEEGEGEQVFSIGTIEVMTDKPIINDKVATTFEIRSGEIEHRQASSLGDALELMPGVLKKDKIGLSGKMTASVRGSAKNTDAMLESFGTQIMVDGVPLSNNAEIASVSMGSTVQQNAGEGIDLRMIPADNIEKIEIIQGIPSARYGDLTGGVVKVEMKSQKFPPRLKFKYSEDTKDLSYNQGWEHKSTILTLSMNYAYSERDIRKDGDEWARISGNLKISQKMAGNKLKMDYSLLASRIMDDEKPTDYMQQKTYNHGYLVSQSLCFQYTHSKKLKTEFRGYLNFKKKDIYRSKLVDAEPTSYVGEVWEKGNVYTPGANLDFNYKQRLWKSFHNLSSGLTFQYDVNRGKGMILNLESNYYGQYSAKRSYSYNWFPGVNQLAWYLEDDIAGRFWKTFNLSLGLRYDMFDMVTPFVESRQGNYWSPRLNLTYNLMRFLKLRAGYGKTAKTPSFNQVYTTKDYTSLADSLSGEVITYAVDGSNPKLKGYYESKIDLGVDIMVKKLGSLRLTYFWSEREKSPVSRSYPIEYLDDPNATSGETFSVYENLGFNRKRGLEILFRTTNYKGINLTVTGNYIYSQSYVRTLIYTTSPNISLNEPYWHEPTKPENQSLIINYNFQYTSKQLGAWLSLYVQHYVWEKTRTNDLYPDAGYEWTNIWFTYPHYWMVDVSLTKSIARSFEFSLYIRNFLEENGEYYHKYYEAYYTRSGGAINYGFELSGNLSDLYGKGK